MNTREEKVSTGTVQRVIGTMGYQQCVAYQKGWVDPSIQKHRVEYAKVMLEKYSNPD